MVSKSGDMLSVTKLLSWFFYSLIWVYPKTIPTDSNLKIIEFIFLIFKELRRR